MPQIYLDHAATTYCDPEVVKAMLPYFTEIYGNPQSLHTQGKKSLIALDTARETIAHHLNCSPSEIVFTSGGTESNNLAIFGIAEAAKKSQNTPLHFITSQIEHPSVRECFKKLEKDSHKVSWIEVNQYGLPNIEQLKQIITPKTALVSIIYANNEIGTILPIEEIGKICQHHNVPFHTDACQAAGALSLNTQKLNTTLLTLNGSKIYGPKGVGVLYVKRNSPLKALQIGGNQEKNLRAGTHNVPAIVGLAKALDLAQKKFTTENQRLTTLRDKLIKELLNKIPDSHLNGHPTLRLPNNVSITIPGISSHELLLHLDESGIYIGTGSACTTGTVELSHVLQAIGLPNKYAHSTIRLTLGQKTTEGDIDYTIKTLPPIVHKLLNPQPYGKNSHGNRS